MTQTGVNRYPSTPGYRPFQAFVLLAQLMQSGGRGESTFTRGSRIMVMRLTVVICLVFSICASTVHANEKDSLDMADASIIF